MEMAVEVKNIQQILLSYVKEKNEANAGVDITVETDLIDSRLIDSLQFVGLLILIEQHLGHSIPASAMDLKNFSTINNIINCFFKS